MIPHHLFHIGCGLVVLLASMALSGCDNTIEPFEEETGQYSIYGYLTVGTSPNYIRVKDLNDPVVEDSTHSLDATVILENLNEGTRETLRDTMVEFDGVYVHNFRADTTVLPDTRYRLTVEGDDGATSTAMATTPALTEVEAGPEGENCITPIRITFHDIGNPSLVRVEIGFRFNFQPYWIRLPAVTGDGERLHLTFTPLDLIQDVLERDPDDEDDEEDDLECKDLSDDRFFVRYIHFGPERLDYYLPFDPLESKNVEDGLGFFGGMREDSFAIPIDTSALDIP